MGIWSRSLLVFRMFPIAGVLIGGCDPLACPDAVSSGARCFRVEGDRGSDFAAESGGSAMAGSGARSDSDSAVIAGAAAPAVLTGIFNVAADTAEDTSTGLVWQRASISTYTWDEATAYCAEKGGAWRLPTHEELFAFKDSKSAVDAVVFPGMPQGFFWTSSMSTRTVAGVDNLWTHNWGTSEKTAHHYVRCVR